MGSELSLADQEISRRVSQFFEHSRRVFRELIQKGQRTGEIPSTVNAEQAASSLLAATIAVKMLSRIYRNKKLVGSVVDCAVSTIR